MTVRLHGRPNIKALEQTVNKIVCNRMKKAKTKGKALNSFKAS